MGIQRNGENKMSIIQDLRDAYQRNPAEALNMLPRLFEAADEGKIIELPCKVGDTVYTAFGKEDKRYKYGVRIQPVEITEIRMYEYDGEVETEFNGAFLLSDFGVDVFTTHKAAEEALKKINKGDKT